MLLPPRFDAFLGRCEAVGKCKDGTRGKENRQPRLKQNNNEFHHVGVGCSSVAGKYWEMKSTLYKSSLAPGLTRFLRATRSSSSYFQPSFSP